MNKRSAPRYLVRFCLLTSWVADTELLTLDYAKYEHKIEDSHHRLPLMLPL